MIESKTHYEIMRVARDASQDEIRHAYRKLANLYHPDKHVDKEFSHKKFTDIQAAHAVLSNPRRRTVYDAELAAADVKVKPRPPKSESAPSQAKSEQPKVQPQECHLTILESVKVVLVVAGGICAVQFVLGEYAGGLLIIPPVAFYGTVLIVILERFFSSVYTFRMILVARIDKILERIAYLKYFDITFRTIYIATISVGFICGVTGGFDGIFAIVAFSVLLWLFARF